MTSPSTTIDAAKQWATWSREVGDTKRADEMAALVEAGDEEAVARAMVPRIAFGTSGLRAKMAAGAAHMNTLVVLQTTQGVLRVMRETGVLEGVDKPAVFIAYDGRHESYHYAKTAAGVFLAAGISVLLPSKTMATPFASYSIAHPLDSAPAPLVGIVVTASHNPASDNGYKVYWDNGAAILPPLATTISDAITRDLAPGFDRVLPEDVVAHEGCIDVYDDLVAAYIAALSHAHRIDPPPAAAKPVVYTAMHGVGTPFITAAFAAVGQEPPVLVAEQAEADPDFSTVTFPNPEEGKGALKLAIETANRVGADLVLANDPDADRLAVAERGADGEFYIFNGNELGLLFAARAWTLLPEAAREDPSSHVFINTVVSSSALMAFAKSVGAEYASTLTGFKYMGNKAIELKEAGKNVVFTYEEAIGFLPGTIVFDKDGIQSAVLAAQYWQSLAAGAGGVTTGLFRTELDRLYATIGYFYIETQYHFCHERKTIDAILDAVRDNEAYARDDFAAAGFDVVRVRDQTTGFDDGETDGKTRLPVGDPMITWWFANGAVATVRASGTEPKLKRYVEVKGASSDKAAVVAAQKKLDDAIVSIVLKPEQNGLIAKGE
ncbi:phosphoglucomutase [Thecamonas trahens ATCC 50062]|uniref:Phosphoglucomutase n=1 Tax=Thecamonas trahens ATCC 50062 TaxID=461836 RepID=A0A0L0DH59_THETB|nr:phosphoglucomutase [Thecamonas trahens ATCC 50062]KNC51647.1 phosphoglucomutase [Thecamonas trahens ATCC 50062]|eukprot:XP_013755787.1 phosphoglucomutase [Thecamonas trahens ATCC 50062]